MFSTTTTSSSKSVKLVSQIYKVDGVHVCKSNQSKQSKLDLIELEDKAQSLLFEVEQGLVGFHNDFKQVLVDDNLRLQQKWVVYNGLLG